MEPVVPSLPTSSPLERLGEVSTPGSPAHQHFD